MFSSKMVNYVIDIIRASKEAQENGTSFEECWKDIPEEIRRSIATTNEGKVGPYYDYLNKLL